MRQLSLKLWLSSIKNLRNRRKKEFIRKAGFMPKSKLVFRNWFYLKSKQKHNKAAHVIKDVYNINTWNKLKLISSHRKTLLNATCRLETRLDVLIVRLHFCNSIAQARQNIIQGKVSVSNRVVKNPGFYVKAWSIIHFNHYKVRTSRAYAKYINWGQSKFYVLKRINKGFIKKTPNTPRPSFDRTIASYHKYFNSDYRRIK